ncbi:hypothetical protein PUNSTDRAFT_134758 [Punctularia strigosozonata HHB-11173 SS5]|uniref:uncharacterized protein n=1 Tax=Punctularia strigosozonata (strain HHB-11173) TaxID=741275 RepID=UPI0004416BDA|nr:uncharacterized protein PUNSTDRAFT_134758 [Punctularia strigosozonata HHB-11173 SS5]EIN08372.1 hypothetical protein PUNSTDRAFT_134758 [Punctularia strigosozonata HHB-11173 SS5]
MSPRPPYIPLYHVPSSSSAKGRMFTPPPSPQPPQTVDNGPAPPTYHHPSGSRESLSVSEAGPSRSRSTSPSPLLKPIRTVAYDLTNVPLLSPPPRGNREELKRQAGRRAKWTSILVVPLVLILVAATTRCLAHPVFLDLIDGQSPTPERAWDWKVHRHKREPQAPASSSSGLAFPSTGSATSEGAPTTTTSSDSNDAVPTIPAEDPVLPTPFPQPLDTLGANFSTLACQNFFINMTQTEAFRSCRPFSMLLQSSNAFIQAQTNLTLLNTIIWGTCNTKLTSDTCVANLNWFATQMQTECSQELDEDNATVEDTLKGLLAFPVMRQAGCLADQTTNTYCYLEAVRNTNPSDVFYYQLPLGLAVPNNTKPTCSACTKSLMSLFDAALPDPASAKSALGSANSTNSTTGTPIANGTTGNVQSVTTTVAALASVYGPAATIASQACGSGYVTIENASTSGAGPMLLVHVWAAAVAIALASGMALLH